MVAKEGAAPQEAANENAAEDQDGLKLKALAEGVLSRAFRPRAASVRRLAEAVLALQAELAAAKKAGKNANKAETTGTKPSRKGSKKKRKLAKIPGQKGK